MQINKDQCPGTMLAFIWGNQTVRWKGADLRNKVWGVETTRLFHHKETRCLQLPNVPNEFGVCMVYSRCCTGCDGARQAWVSRHFCSLGNDGSPEFLWGFQLTLIFLPFQKRWREKGGILFEFRHSIPAFPMAILEIYGMLSLTTAGLFMSLYLLLHITPCLWNLAQNQENQENRGCQQNAFMLSENWMMEARLSTVYLNMIIKSALIQICAVSFLWENIMEYRKRFSWTLVGW